MTSERAAADNAPSGAGGEKANLSELLAKILGQLSVNAWLPAAVLAANGVMLVRYCTAPDAGLVAAASFPVDRAAGLLVTALLLLLLSAIVVQAFELPAVRLLQGDWPVLPVVQRITAIGIGLQYSKVRRLGRRYDRALRTALEGARSELVDAFAMSDRQFKALVVAVVDNPGPADPVGEGVDRGDVDNARAIPWRPHVSAYDEARLAALERRLARFPIRITSPTVLGCAVELLRERAQTREILPEEVLFRSFEKLPPALRDELTSTRSRLNLYTLLTFVLGGLGLLGLGLLGVGAIPRSSWWLPLTYLAGARMTYRAATHSARLWVEARVTAQDHLRGRPAPAEATGDGRSQPLAGSSAAELNRDGARPVPGAPDARRTSRSRRPLTGRAP